MFCLRCFSETEPAHVLKKAQKAYRNRATSSVSIGQQVRAAGFVIWLYPLFPLRTALDQGTSVNNGDR